MSMKRFKSLEDKLLSKNGYLEDANKIKLHVTFQIKLNCIFFVKLPISISIYRPSTILRLSDDVSREDRVAGGLALTGPAHTVSCSKPVKRNITRWTYYLLYLSVPDRQQFQFVLL